MKRLPTAESRLSCYLMVGTVFRLRGASNRQSFLFSAQIKTDSPFPVLSVFGDPGICRPIATCSAFQNSSYCFEKTYVKKPPVGGFPIQDGVLTTRLIDSSALGCKQYIMSVLLLYTFVKVDAKNND